MATSTTPPFRVTGSRPGLWQEVIIGDYSDGDVRYWPGKPLYKPSSENNYLFNLATSWVQMNGLTRPDVNYYLNKLPEGYSLFEQDAPTQGVVYKRLFGHPTGKYYNSIKKFFPHFQWLMGGMEGNCECELCTGKRIIGPKRSEIGFIASRPRLRESLKMDREDSGSRSRSATGRMNEREKKQPKLREAPTEVDEEGTEDVYKKCIQELYKHRDRKIDEDIQENSSIDWRAERKYLPSQLTQISLQHSFVPRIGELVLWCPNFPDELDLILNPETGRYQFYSFEKERFLQSPLWFGGVVVEVPSSVVLDGPLDFPDIISNTKKNAAHNTSGFRIEKFPDPNNNLDKSLSKQYKYVPLRQIRPLSQWQTLLRGISERKLDPSIKYALSVMSSVSLLEKHRFTGDWPNASIHCKGIYIGADLILVKDAIRILGPKSTKLGSDPQRQIAKDKIKQECTDIMVVSSIRLNLLEITPENTLGTSPHLCTRSSITLIGSAYTLDERRCYQSSNNSDHNSSLNTVMKPKSLSIAEVKSILPVVGANEYGDWFPLHPPGTKYEISFERVLGRLHEPGAINLWTGMSSRQQSKNKPPGLNGEIFSTYQAQVRPALSYDLSAILAGRRYGTQTDERIPVTPPDQIAWFWADTRALALNVATLNGWEVGVHDRIRTKVTLRSWRAVLRVLDTEGQVGVLDAKETGLPQRKGRVHGSKLVDGRIIYPGAGQMEVDLADGERGSESWGSQKRVRNSQMAGSALDLESEDAGSTSVDEEDEYKDTSGDDPAGPSASDTDGGPANKSFSHSTKNNPTTFKQEWEPRQQSTQPSRKRPRPLSEIQIVRSVEPGEFGVYDDEKETDDESRNGNEADQSGEYDEDEEEYGPSHDHHDVEPRLKDVDVVIAVSATTGSPRPLVQHQARVGTQETERGNYEAPGRQRRDDVVEPPPPPPAAAAAPPRPAPSPPPPPSPPVGESGSGGPGPAEWTDRPGGEKRIKI